MTENAEDCKRYVFFLTLNLTKNDNCKRYDEYEYDRKQLLSTVNIYIMFTVLRSQKYEKRSIYNSYPNLDTLISPIKARSLL